MENNIKIFSINCPHCNFEMEIEELNCCIFRCGILKNIKLVKDNISINKYIDDKMLEEMIEQKILSINPTQIPPHLSFEECNRLKTDNLIYGCGKPFKIIKMKEGEIKIEECGYI